jgi:hypothetical protein
MGYVSAWNSGSWETENYIEMAVTEYGYGSYEITGNVQERYCMMWYGGYDCGSTIITAYPWLQQLDPPSVTLQTSTQSPPWNSGPLNIYTSIAGSSAYLSDVQWGGCDPISFADCFVDTTVPGAVTVTWWGLFVNAWVQRSLLIDVQQPPPPPTLSLQSPPGASESGKPTHFLVLLNAGSGGTLPVDFVLSPPEASPSIVAWTGGALGANNLQRLVSTSSANDTTLTATIAGQVALSITIHVVDAQAPPVPTSLAAALLPPVRSDLMTPVGDCGFACVVVDIDAAAGVVAPTYRAHPYLDGNFWVFRLSDVQHTYKVYVPPVPHPQGLTNVVSAANPFPTHPMFPTTIQAKAQAVFDFDATGNNLIPYGPVAAAPPMHYFWSEPITQAHEQAHVDRFYNNPSLWRFRMGLFKGDLEAPSQWVIYNCLNVQTTTRPTVEATVKQLMQFNFETLHQQAARDNVDQDLHEVFAHGVSNPMYEVLKLQILANPGP